MTPAPFKGGRFAAGGNKNRRAEYTVFVKYILFTGGGSAGHVVPNLALMNELRYVAKLGYMGTGGVEKRLVTEAGYPFFEVETPKLVRGFDLSNLSIPFRLHTAKRRALALLKRERPALVFSKGGFASYPAAWAAHRLHIPLLTHESDLSPGLCTKLIAKKCEAVLTSFPETAKCFRNGQCVGSPIRKETLCGERERARRKYGFSSRDKVLLVLGGGSGSRALNGAVRECLSSLLSFCRILHLCGKDIMEDPPEGYVQREFERDMGSAYACADCVLCRAGSNTLFEVLALKKPALLVPLARGSRGDQIENARYFSGKGLCRVLPEAELERLPAAAEALFEDETLRDALENCTVSSGTRRVLDVIRSFAE